MVAIETGWLQRLRETVLYRYEFAADGFESHDEGAGYWVSRQTVVPHGRGAGWATCSMR